MQLTLKKCLELLPGVVEVCKRCETDSLKAITAALDHPSAKMLLAKIHAVVDPDAAITHKFPVQQRAQIVFAVKPGINGLLDVARQTFIEVTLPTPRVALPSLTDRHRSDQVVEELYALVERYREAVGAEVRLHFTTTRGFHLIVAPEAMGSPASK